MKTLKTVPVEIVDLKIGEAIPDNKVLGNIYYAPQLRASSHLCLCGCGANQFVLHTKEVIEIEINAKDCKSHYIITNGIAKFV